MNRTNKYLIECKILILTVLFIFCLQQRGLAQVDPCSTPKVAVVMQVEGVKEGEFFKHLNDQYPSQPKGSWLNQIQEKVLEELRMNSPGTQFIRATGDVPKDCDYYFKYIFSLIGAGQDIEVAGLLHSEYTAYWMSSTLAQNSACGNQNYILNVEITSDNRDINKTIERNIAAHGNIGNRIKEREESHAVPPRGPEMITSQDREYVSPIEEEKELKIKIDVSNCKGEPVYDRYHGQWVYLPRYTERGEIRPTKGFPQELLVTDNQVILIIVRPVGASATYTLKKGIKASQDPVEIKTCGIDREEVKEAKIQIHGLELKVKPKKKSVSPGEKTDIIISLNEVDTKNKKYPVSGKELEIKVTGIVNGDIDPSGDVITDQNGKAILFYDAGDKDKKVVVKAKFQPKDYPEFVEDETAITVLQYEGYVIMTYSIDYDHSNGDGHYHEDATVRLNLGKELQSIPLGEHLLGIWYPVKSGVLLKANAKDVYREEIKTGQSFHLPDWSEWARNYYIIMVLDTKTGKFVRGGRYALSVDFTWSDGDESTIDGADEDGLIKGGDGVRLLTGGCSGDSGWKFSWTMHMRKHNKNK